MKQQNSSLNFYLKLHSTHRVPLVINNNIKNTCSCLDITIREINNIDVNNMLRITENERRFVKLFWNTGGGQFQHLQYISNNSELLPGSNDFTKQISSYI